MKTHAWFVGASAGVVTLFFGCSGTNDSGFGSGQEGKIEPNLPAEPVPDLSMPDAGTGPSAVDGCSDAAKLIYLFTSDAELYSFDPPSKKLVKIGALNCPASFGASPNSMAVGRDATAWVNYADDLLGDGSLFKVDLATGACKATTFSSTKFHRFGMGFSTDGAGSTNEALFIAGTSGEGLGRVDPATTRLSSVGSFKGALASLSPELTGTGDGRLYGFFVSTQSNVPAHVARIDKSTVQVSEDVTLNSLSGISAWAFSFWGGDFYLYASKGTSSTVIYRYRPGDRAEQVYMATGIRVVGAGVSTCAPLTSPK